MQFWQEYKIIVITLAILSAFYILISITKSPPLSYYEQKPITSETPAPTPITNPSKQSTKAPTKNTTPTPTPSTQTQQPVTSVPTPQTNPMPPSQSPYAPISTSPISATGIDFKQYTRSIVQLQCPNILDKSVIVQGSGSIIDSHGYILTNRHLILGFDTSAGFYASRNCNVYITDPNNLSNSSPQYAATLVSILTDYDVAIMRIVKDSAGNLLNQPLYFTPVVINSIVPKIGDQIFTIGYPSMSYSEFHVTSGKVTALTIINGMDMIKIDALISPGNSGGALLDSQGKLIGMPTSGKNGESGGYSLEIYDIANWINSVIRNTVNLSSQEIINSTVDITKNPFPPGGQAIVAAQPATTATTTSNPRYFETTGQGFCDNNPGVSTIMVGSYEIPQNNIVCWSETKVCFNAPASIPSGQYPVYVRGYKTGFGYCNSVAAGGLTIY